MEVHLVERLSLLEMELALENQILSKAVCILFYANALRKSMDSSVLPFVVHRHNS